MPVFETRTLPAGIIDPGYSAALTFCSRHAGEIFPKLDGMKIEARPILIILLLTCLASGPKTQAVSPAPDGGYPGGNTAEGQSALFSRTTGGFNTAVGLLSLRSLTTGSFNTGVGAGTLLANTADENTATGAGALLSNTTGAGNTANGTFALVNNTTGFYNTGNGAFALQNNTTGTFNTANGFQALLNNTTGGDNTATGLNALAFNTIGRENTATGLQALFNNTTGSNNTATGLNALLNNTIGEDNTATGFQALFGNITGFNNTANGFTALVSNTTGYDNTADGWQSLFSNVTGDHNTANGYLALANSTGIGNTAFGAGAGFNVTTANSVICIGAEGANVSNSCFIGNIRGITTVNNDGLFVVIDSAGQLGTMSSSRKFKKEIKPMDNASEAILALKPVRFHYKSDKTNRPEFGLIAEDVAKVNPDLVVRDEYGEIYTVRYEAVNAMLLNEFLKEHRKVEEQQAAITGLKALVAQQQKDFQTAIVEQRKEIKGVVARLKQQDAKIQTVSAQLQLNKVASATLAKNQ